MQSSVDAHELDGSAAFRLRTGDLEAAVVPGVGMVVASLRHDGRELLGQRGGLAAYRDRGSTFGVPLLFPWANRLPGLAYEAAGHRVELDPATSPVKRDGNGLPIHGLLTACPDWEVAHATADQDGAEVLATLVLDEHPALLAAFPFPCALALTHRLDAGGLQTTLTVMPTGDVPVPVAFGFHPYLAPGGDRRLWELELPVAAHAALDERGLPTGVVEPAEPGARLLGDAVYDDLYPALEPDPVFAVATRELRLEVAFDPAYPCAQVYAPADADVVCFEPMTAPTAALATGDGLRLIDPGGSFTAAFRIDVEPA